MFGLSAAKAKTESSKAATLNSNILGNFIYQLELISFLSEVDEEMSNLRKK